MESAVQTATPLPWIPACAGMTTAVSGGHRPPLSYFPGLTSIISSAAWASSAAGLPGAIRAV